MPAPSSLSSRTPRTDAAERFFHEAGKPPIGFVDSKVSRTLELELAHTLDHLKKHGVEAPEGLDTGNLTLARIPRKPGSSFTQGAASAAQAAASIPPAVAAQVKLLKASLSEGLGDVHSYEDGSVLYRRGERTEHVFMLLQGQLRLSQQQDGSEDALLGPGHVFAEHGLFEQGVHTESLTAVGQVQCALLPANDLQTLLAADTSLLPHVLMALAMQYRQVLRITQALNAGRAMTQYEVLGHKTLTRPELHRALADAQAQAPGNGPAASQLMCLKLQVTDHLANRLYRAGMSLGGPADKELLGLGLMLVQGQAQLRLGEHELRLGQGSVIGVAEGLTGQAFSWQHAALEDIDARAFPVERALERLERADPVFRALASHLCALVLAEQRDFKG